MKDHIATLQKKIVSAAQAAHRPADDITLIAVSKQQPDDAIVGALNAGLRTFGENRVQEAEERWTERRKTIPDLKLHLIGPLQTNKVREAVALFDVIHTMDRIKLADAVLEEMQRQSKTMFCFIQVNTGDEDQKAGTSLADLPVLLDHCKTIGLPITGLMCIPPINDPAALHFALLKKLAKQHDLPHLSMGMSADFEQAIALGATHIRIGTALFGERMKAF